VGCQASHSTLSIFESIRNCKLNPKKTQLNSTRTRVTIRKATVAGTDCTKRSESRLRGANKYSNEVACPYVGEAFLKGDGDIRLKSNTVVCFAAERALWFNLAPHYL